MNWKNIDHIKIWITNNEYTPERLHGVLLLVTQALVMDQHHDTPRAHEDGLQAKAAAQQVLTGQVQVHRLRLAPALIPDTGGAPPYPQPGVLKSLLNSRTGDLMTCEETNDNFFSPF